jgi:thiamine biosynthesis lipoprotein
VTVVAEAPVYSAGFAAVGTWVTVDVVAPEPAAVVAGVRAVVEDLEAKLSRFREGSDIWRLNRAATGDWPVAPATDAILRAAVRGYHATGGLFDVTLGTGTLIRHPTEPRRWRVTPGTAVDLGGIAKGYIADAARDRAVELGATSVLVSLGTSSIAVAGPRPGSRPGPWRIGLRRPGGGRAEALGVVELVSGSLSTSSVDERPVDGARAEQATVRAADGVTAEIWSTALLLGGPAALTRWYRPGGGWEAVVVTATALIATPSCHLLTS